MRVEAGLDLLFSVVGMMHSYTKQQHKKALRGQGSMRMRCQGRFSASPFIKDDGRAWAIDLYVSGANTERW